MHFTRRKKIVVAIGAFFILLVGYRVIDQATTKTVEKPPVHVSDSDQKEIHEQRQAKSVPEKITSALTPEQQEELGHIKAHSLIYNGPTSVNQVAITFDDGPDTTFTPKVLDILKEYHVVATFFVQGNMCAMCPDVLRRIDEEGHTIGNHSYNHPQFTKISNTRIEQQLTRTEREIERVIGKEPTLFRAPYGDVNKRVISQVKSKGYNLIQWSIDTNDWRGRSAKAIRATVQVQCKPGSIILQHSNGTRLQGTVDALPGIIEDLQRRGYQFVTVDQMLDIPPYR